MIEHDLTFGELDELIELWTPELEEYQRCLINQTQAVNEVFWINRLYQERFNAIHFKLAILHSTFEQLEKTLMVSTIHQQVLEEKILSLEKQVQPLLEQPFKDFMRDNLYESAEKINHKLMYYKGEAEIIDTNIASREKVAPNDPVQQIAKIMTRLLELLYYVDNKAQHIKRRLNWIETLNK